MEVTLQYFDECPNWRQAERYLRQLTEEFPDLTIQKQRIDTPAEAERLGFHGSPSVVIDGVDVFATPDTPVGLSCRRYSTPDGPAGSPTIDQLRDALERRV